MATPLKQVMAVSAMRHINTGLIFAALTLPTLGTFNTGPFPSFYNQIAAILLWCAIVWLRRPVYKLWVREGNSGALLFIGAVLLLFLLALASKILTNLPLGLFFTFSGEIFAAALVFNFASSTDKVSFGKRFICSVGVCALLNCIPGLIEAFLPALIDGNWLAAAGASRISGNIRQANLLATMCALGTVACAALLALTKWRLSLAAMAILVLTLTVVLTGSRVGLVELSVIGAAGVWQGRLAKSVRRLMVCVPAWAFVFWLALQLWSSLSGSFHGRAPDLATSRYIMWAQCLRMIAAHPWLGVGLGNFNFAWTLTSFDRSNPETFDHAHNLILHWAVEFGIPATLLLVGLLGRSLWKIIQTTCRVDGDEFIIRGSCILMVTLVLLHSMTEYPLWYSYFLLPTVFAWGIAAGPAENAHASIKVSTGEAGAMNLPGKPTSKCSARPPTDWVSLCSLFISLGAAVAVYDYQKIVVIYHPFEGAPPIDQRVVDGRKALIYGYLADRFAGTLAVNGTRTLEPYKTATRQLLDMRLLIAWSLAMEETGHLDKARYLAQRIRDFNDPVAQQFFIECKLPRADVKLPWQCTPPSGHYTYEDFL